jgi:hypothetical protein
MSRLMIFEFYSSNKREEIALVMKNDAKDNINAAYPEPQRGEDMFWVYSTTRNDSGGLPSLYIKTEDIDRLIKLIRGDASTEKVKCCCDIPYCRKSISLKENGEVWIKGIKAGLSTQEEKNVFVQYLEYIKRMKPILGPKGSENDKRKLYEEIRDFELQPG